MDYMNPSSDESTSQLFYPESSIDDGSTISEDNSIENNHTTTIKLKENTNWTGYCTLFTIDIFAEMALLKY